MQEMRGKFNRAHHGVANMTRCFMDRRKHPRFFVMQIGVRQKDKSIMFDMVDAVDDVMIDGIGADSATSEAYPEESVGLLLLYSYPKGEQDD